MISIYTSERRESLGLNVSLVYALNTAGAIFGSLLIAFLAMDEEELRQYVGDGPLATDNDAYFLPHADETDQIMTAVKKSVAEP